MEKNVIVTDASGKIIGETYPKRARGLVKNGRAEYVGDCEIRLRFRKIDGVQITHDPSVNKNTEDIIMSKAIDFNAREFKFDKECTANVGSRMFVTDFKGDNTEQFEIGDWKWSWTQIRCEKLLEKNTDYLFRFAMTGGHNDTNDAVSQLIIFFDEDWEERYVYPLDKSRYNPAVSKRTEDGLLRVFEVPFNTGNAVKTTFLLIAQHAVARFFAPYELSAYSELEDMTYSQWWEDRQRQLRGGSWSSFGNDFGRFVENKVSRAADMVGRFVNTGKNSDKFADFDYDVKVTGESELTNENKSEKEFGELLRLVTDGGMVNIENCNITAEPDGEIYNNIGSSCDGAVLDVKNTCMTARAFGMLVNKLGDGAVMNVTNCCIRGTDSCFVMGRISDGMAVTAANSQLSAAAFAMIAGRSGDGCDYNFINCDISTEGIDSMYLGGCHGDGIVMHLNGCAVPKEIVGMIRDGFGDGCMLDFSSSVEK
ncbi:MAG: hypothetical protein ACI4K7_12755 [Oscillospiraceae bacterium]